MAFNLKKKLAARVAFIEECDGYYYIAPQPKHFFDETVYRINKRTKIITRIPYIMYLGLTHDRSVRTIFSYKDYQE